MIQIDMDMDMPKMCGDCPLSDPAMYCHLLGLSIAALNAKRDDCPLKEVKRGKWIPVRSYEAFGGDKIMWEIRGNPVAFYYCSECRNDAYAGEDGESLLTKYCPECGAKMEVEHE